MTSTSAVLPQDSFWFKANVALNPVQHSARYAAYRITHVMSGKVFVGWLGDAYGGLRTIASRLQAGNFPNEELQALVSHRDQACELEVFMVDSRLSTEDAHDTLRNAMEVWIHAAGEQYIHSSTKLPPRKTDVPVRVVKERVVLPGRIPNKREPKVKVAKPAKERVSKPSAKNLMPWKNLYVGSRTHLSAGAFQLKHLSTGKVFIGSSKNISDSLSNISTRLRNHLCSSKELQAAYDADPQFELVLQMFLDAAVPEPERIEQAIDLSLQWLSEAGEHGVYVLKARLRGGTGWTKKVTEGVPASHAAKFRADGQMHQVKTKATSGMQELPRRDFLHDCWFPYQPGDPNPPY